MNAWIDLETSTEDAAHLRTRLKAYAGEPEVDTESGSASTIAYSANGLILRQKESVDVTEYRALTEAAAKKLKGCEYDDTVRSIYYHELPGGGDWVACGITTGTKTEVKASRVNEADGWRAVFTTTTYAAADASGWSTVRPSGATSTGIEISREPNREYLYKADGDTIFTNEDAVVVQYKFLTLSEARQLVAANTSNTTYFRTYVHGAAPGIVVSVNAWTGTIVNAREHYVDSENGYTVEVTTRTFGASGTNWS